MNTTFFAELKNWRSIDYDFKEFISTYYDILLEETEIEGTCRNLGIQRQSALKKLYYKLSTVTFIQNSLLFSFLTAIPSTDYSNFTTEDKVKSSIEVEIGIRDNFGRLRNIQNGALPRAKYYGCIAVVFNNLDLLKGKIEYKLRSEYEDSISHLKSAFINQARMQI